MHHLTSSAASLTEEAACNHQIMHYAYRIFSLSWIASLLSFRFHECFALGNGFPFAIYLCFRSSIFYYSVTKKKYISIGHLGRNVRCGALCDWKKKGSSLAIVYECVLLWYCMAFWCYCCYSVGFFFYTLFVRCIWHAWLMGVFKHFGENRLSMRDAQHVVSEGSSLCIKDNSITEVWQFSIWFHIKRTIECFSFCFGHLDSVKLSFIKKNREKHLIKKWRCSLFCRASLWLLPNHKDTHTINQAVHSRIAVLVHHCCKAKALHCPLDWIYHQLVREIQFYYYFLTERETKKNWPFSKFVCIAKDGSIQKKRLLLMHLSLFVNWEVFSTI